MQFSWKSTENFKDIRFELGQEDAQGILKITINRPEVRNAFRPQTVNELQHAFTLAREMTEVGVVVLCGEGEFAFCSGGDQKIRGDAGYIGEDGVPRLNILEVQRQIRTLPKPVIAMVAGYAVGGGHVLHMMCDLTIASENAQAEAFLAIYCIQKCHTFEYLFFVIPFYFGAMWGNFRKIKNVFLIYFFVREACCRRRLFLAVFCVLRCFK